MAKDYTEFLAATVLNDGQIVNYRSLSRALKVHSNLAKQYDTRMLYDFHHKQNSKKPGTLHATYLISGRLHRPHTSQPNGSNPQDGEDTHMRSSPLPSSSAPASDQPSTTASTRIRTITLVKEEDLSSAKAQLASITSIHIYSLGPGSIKDMQTLSECNRKVGVDYANEDPLEVWKQYGTIQNPGTKRRTMRRPAPTAPAAPPLAPSVARAKGALLPAEKGKDEETRSERGKAAKPETKEVGKATPEPEATATATTTAAAKKGGVGGKPATVRRESSNIFKSFAEAKPPKAKKQDTEESTDASQVTEDNPMKGMSDDDDGEDDADAMMLDEKPAKEPTGKSKKQREEELRKMMDAEDDAMEDAPSNPIDAPAEATPEEAEEPQPKEEPAETVTVANGRRRGRRRVMKKKTVRDEEGYLVTKEEPGWESFSEEEPVPKKQKVSAPAPAAKGKKGGAKPGQGNIMSFFSKK